ncbi:MAG: hypothetical protein J7641_00855 [Cyanobacteria bacterium SID2]|nr:hypothetical protein [Cyanobacteria bacterium SID2]
MQAQTQVTPVTQPTATQSIATQPVITPVPSRVPVQVPEATPSSGMLLMLTFCVWLLRQKLA